MPNAPKTPAGSRDMRLQHVGDTRPQCQIGMPHNAGADSRQAIKAAIRHGGNAGGEFRFADRPQRFRPGCSVHGAAFSEDGGDDVVAGVQILKKFVEAIAPGRRVEEMMVRIDDWIVRINNWLYPAREPIAANRRKWVRRLCLACSFGHCAQDLRR